MARAVTFDYYQGAFGGALPADAFAEAEPVAESHVRWLCALRGADEGSDAFLRAVCAATDAFAEYGAGEVGGFQVGSFSVKNYASRETSGEALATAAALRELGLSGMAFSGAGR